MGPGQLSYCVLQMFLSSTDPLSWHVVAAHMTGFKLRDVFSLRECKIGLTSNQKGVSLEPMKRLPKSLIPFAVAFFFVSAVLCATLAAPGQSFASITSCSEHNQAMEMAGCEHRSYFCSFSRSSHFVSERSLSWTRSNDSVKNTLGVAVGEALLDSSGYGGGLARNEHTNALTSGPHKVSIHLYNSVLTL